jgi:hypothetical protein
MSLYCAEVLSPRPASPPDAIPAREASGAGELSVLVIRERTEGFFLERLAANGGSLGETQYEALDEAMGDAHRQYDPLSNWRFCPDNADPLAYLRRTRDS